MRKWLTLTIVTVSLFSITTLNGSANWPSLFDCHLRCLDCSGDAQKELMLPIHFSERFKTAQVGPVDGWEGPVESTHVSTGDIPLISASWVQPWRDLKGSAIFTVYVSTYDPRARLAAEIPVPVKQSDGRITERTAAYSGDCSMR